MNSESTQAGEAVFSISAVTRRKIFNYIQLNKISWSGQRGELDFLASLYDLKKMPTTDYRKVAYPTAYEDIQQHRIMNDDWDGHYWIFTDPRFNLLRCSDEEFLRFLCEMFHPTSWIDPRPTISWDKPKRKTEDRLKAVYELQKDFNNYLLIDGWEIYVESLISTEPIFSFRKNAPSVSLGNVKLIQEKIDSNYINKQISRILENVDKDPEAAIGASKEFLETLCKHIIREKGGDISAKADFNELISVTRDLLRLLPENIDDEQHGNRALKKVLGGIGSIFSGIAELRNLYGTGHGKDSVTLGLNPVHARLLTNLATALGAFLFEIHEKS